MENLKVEVEETKTYWERMKSILTWGFALVLVFCLILYYTPVEHKVRSDLQMFFAILYVFILISSLLILFSDAVCAYYISFIEIKEDRVHIIYTKRDKKLELNDTIEKFEFKYGPGYRLPAFIKIKYNDEFAVRQHKVWNWKIQGAFNQAKKYLENRKLLGISMGLLT